MCQDPWFLVTLLLLGAWMRSIDPVLMVEDIQCVDIWGIEEYFSAQSLGLSLCAWRFTSHWTSPRILGSFPSQKRPRNVQNLPNQPKTSKLHKKSKVCKTCNFLNWSRKSNPMDALIDELVDAMIGSRIHDLINQLFHSVFFVEFISFTASLWFVY